MQRKARDEVAIEGSCDSLNNICRDQRCPASESDRSDPLAALGRTATRPPQLSLACAAGEHDWGKYFLSADDSHFQVTEPFAALPIVSLTYLPVSPLAMPLSLKFAVIVQPPASEAVPPTATLAM